ncbi:acyltransferase domain-containing protein [Niabella ginsengisoli]|uniref:Acyltransferase domain-containing protein n=2 Tax=Niabella ginsengisoli TaxID=522298 RepID=A0ABS9SHR2_9BACT|nr:acyltransferase domain-containing protein [Niabella ginsengisoli]
MGKELYVNEPVYKAAIDECAEILLQEINEDIREIIFTEESDEAADKLKNTYYTQPATFITSYALAKYYMSMGINPAAFVGHSIGEFVSAHLSGILTLADALKLVAARARLISGLPGGTMLSVRTARKNVLPLMPATLSLAANNAPNLCVVSGEASDVDNFSKILEQNGIVNKPLRTSHAFHSHMMDPIISPLNDVAASFNLSVPKIPILSTVTASWLKDGEATDPGYWSKHARATVNFSDAINALITELNPVFVEVGPGNATTTLIKQQGGAVVSRVVNSIEPGISNSDLISIKKTIGKLWTLGVDINWQSLHEAENANVLHDLPTYAYDKKKYWVEPVQVQQLTNQPELTNNSSNNEVEEIVDNADLTRKERLISRIKTILGEASGNDISDTNPHFSFIELGFDSLLLTQVASSFKKEFRVPVTFRQLSEEYDTLDKLSTYLDSTLPADVYSAAKKEKPKAASKIVETNVPVDDVDNKALLQTILQQINILTQQVAELQKSQMPTGISPVGTNGNNHSLTKNDLQNSYTIEANTNHRDVKILDNSNPPVPGAKLGKDQNGNPAWFIADSNNPGRYLQIPI